MAQRKKSEHRGLARIRSVYKLSEAAVGYDEWVGLELNAEDMGLVQEWRIFRAMSFALNPTATLPPEWFDAMTDTPEEAARMEYDTNVRRK